MQELWDEHKNRQNLHKPAVRAGAPACSREQLMIRRCPVLVAHADGAYKGSYRTIAEANVTAINTKPPIKISAPRVVALDNLREGMAVPDIYDPTINPLSTTATSDFPTATGPASLQEF